MAERNQPRLNSVRIFLVCLKCLEAKWVNWPEMASTIAIRNFLVIIKQTCTNYEGCDTCLVFRPLTKNVYVNYSKCSILFVCPQRDERRQHGTSHRGLEQRDAVGQRIRLPLDSSASCQVLEWGNVHIFSINLAFVSCYRK